MCENNQNNGDKLMNMQLLKLAAITSCLILLTGCGTSMFVHPLENPIIEDKVGYSSIFSDKEELGTLATTSQRRIVLVKLKGTNIGKFCAEPSPDAADNLASTLSIVLKAQIEKADVSGSAGAEFDKTLATTVEKLGVRSQGVQFFRDGMYSLCQSFLNQAITAQEFNSTYIELMKVSANLIEVELKYKDSIIAAPAKQIKTTEQLTEAAQKQKLDSIKSKGVAQAEKEKQEAATFTAKANLDTAKATAALDKAKAENALLAEKHKVELEKVKAANAIQAEKDKAEIAIKQAEIDKAIKDKELETALSPPANAEAGGTTDGGSE